MDCKIGVRTYLEEELLKAEKTPTPRKVCALVYIDRSQGLLINNQLVDLNYQQQGSKMCLTLMVEPVSYWTFINY